MFEKFTATLAWGSALGFFPKFMITILVVAFAALLLWLLWFPTQSSKDDSDDGTKPILLISAHAIPTQVPGTSHGLELKFRATRRLPVPVAVRVTMSKTVSSINFYTKPQPPGFQTQQSVDGNSFLIRIVNFPLTEEVDLIVRVFSVEKTQFENIELRPF